jgi:NAD(P)H-dependent FMN reductase
MPNLGVIIASTRERRGATSVAAWFLAQAARHGAFAVTTLDLKQWNLPMLEEPEHPRLRQYQQQSTRDWSAAVDAQDAFVIVTPEYNYSSPPALVNALDHVFHEWQYKPVGFVSYGGVSGGLRSVQMTKQIVTTLKMVPIFEAVVLPFYTKLINPATGTLEPGDVNDRAAAAMLTELLRWADALQVLRP